MNQRDRILPKAAAAALALTLALPGIAGAAGAAASGSGDLAPIRETAAKLGAEVRWDPAGRTVSVTKNGIALVFKIGEPTATLNGLAVPLEEPLRIVQNRAFFSTELLNKLLGPNAETPEETTDPAELFIRALSQGNGAEALRYASPELKQAATEAQLGGLWAAYAQVYGTVAKQLAKTESSNAVHDNVKFTYQTDKAAIAYTVRLNHKGEVDDLYIEPASPSAYQAPKYDNPSAYKEEEVTIGEGAFALPGTLTLPTTAGEGPFPVIVLVHGSGTNNRDEAIGSSKSFRDLAVGLAAQGIAVLRYDKVTYEHTFKIAADPKLTLKRETVDDALTAVRFLKGRKDVDASRIFVAGHSQGGFAMPLIVDADKDRAIKGTILLSGPSGKFADILVEQQQELIKRLKGLGVDTAPYEQSVAQVKAVADMVNDPQYSVDRLPENFPLGSPYWWYEQRDYVPVELAKKQSGPMLVLQGENDWQVPVDQLEGWKSGLKDRTDVEYKSYPKVTHLLAEYDGVSTGSEYGQPANVAEAIVNDIAAWVKKLP